MKMSLSEAAHLTGGELIGRNASFEGLQVDSRVIKGGELFCAVKGERTDGHRFVRSAMIGGAAGALVQHDPRPAPKEKKSSESEEDKYLRLGWEHLMEQEYRPVVLVASVVGAMAAIALHFRRMLKGPVIGVTGSGGKTTVKEMIAAALSPLGDVHKTEGNLNTEYGVPMAWSRLDNRHKSAVIEMAMRGPGQIAHLARMSAPDIAVITSIGSAHIGELGSREAIARAKSELLESLPAGGVAIIPSVTDFSAILTNSTSARVVTVGEGGDYRVLEWRQSGGFVEFAVGGPQGEVAGTVPGIGEVQATNAAMAIAAAVAAGVSPESAAGGLRRTVFPDKRMQVLDSNGVTIWLDAYNSSPESCRLALLAFRDLTPTGRKIAILGDMLELGEFAEAAHRDIGTVAAGVGLDELALVGALAPWIGSAARDAGFVGEMSFFEDSAAAHVVIDRAQPGDAILIKGSRGVALEDAL